MGVTVEYRCPDGTPFPVTFRNEGDEASSWRIDMEHVSMPATTLCVAIDELGRPGGERAYGEVGLRMPSFWTSSPDAHGWLYGRVGDIPGDEMGALFAGLGTLVEQYGSAHAIWRDYSLPRVQDACDRLRSTSMPIEELAHLHAYAFQLTMIPAFVGGNDINLLEAALHDVAGDGARLAALELSQGHANATLTADAALWRLAEVARSSPRVAAAVTGPSAALAVEELRAGAGEEPFFDALAAFLDGYGWRTEAWTPGAPCWRELGAGFWSVLASHVANRAASPEDAVVAGARRREELLDHWARLLADDPEQEARLRRRAGRLATYVDMREERAHWQLVLCGSTRHALLEHGRRLASAGAIDDPDDVFFLRPDEVESPEPGDLRPVAAARRAEHDRWAAVVPPPVLDPGAKARRSAARERNEDGQRPENAPECENVRQTLQCLAASRGVATGTARVVTDLADAHRIEPGDVLVCRMTSPPWTPLFGLVSAIVVDSGDLGSHSAITAREYGIPAVLATDVGTSVIPDGVTVTVDGTAGTVTWG